MMTGIVYTRLKHNSDTLLSVRTILHVFTKHSARFHFWAILYVYPFRNSFITLLETHGCEFLEPVSFSSKLFKNILS